MGSVDKPAACRRVCFSGARAKFTARVRVSSYRRSSTNELSGASSPASWAAPSLLYSPLPTSATKLPYTSVQSVAPHPVRHRRRTEEKKECRELGREGTPRSTPRGAGGAEGARKGRNTEQAGRRGILCRLCTAERRILTLQSCCGHLHSARPVPGDEAATMRGFPLTLCWSRARSFKSPSKQQRLRLRRHFQRVDSAASGWFSDLCQEPARNRSS